MRDMTDMRRCSAASCAAANAAAMRASFSRRASTAAFSAASSSSAACRSRRASASASCLSAALVSPPLAPKLRARCSVFCTRCCARRPASMEARDPSGAAPVSPRAARRTPAARRLSRVDRVARNLLRRVVDMERRSLAAARRAAELPPVLAPPLPDVAVEAAGAALGAAPVAEACPLLASAAPAEGAGGDGVAPAGDVLPRLPARAGRMEVLSAMASTDTEPLAVRGVLNSSALNSVGAAAAALEAVAPAAIIAGGDGDGVGSTPHGVDDERVSPARCWLRLRKVSLRLARNRRPSERMALHFFTL